jgi:hypothetical protein
MSRSTVRTALYNFFGGATPNITGINTVFEAQPKQILENQMPAMFFSLPESQEQRWTTGFKKISYTIHIMIVGVGYDTDSQIAEKVFDQMVDTIATQIRTSKNLAGSMLIFGESFQTATEVERNDEAVWLNGIFQVIAEETVQA